MGGEERSSKAREETLDKKEEGEKMKPKPRESLRLGEEEEKKRKGWTNEPVGPSQLGIARSIVFERVSFLFLFLSNKFTLNSYLVIDLPIAETCIQLTA